MWQKWWKGGGRGGVVCSIATDNSVHTWSVPCVDYTVKYKVDFKNYYYLYRTCTHVTTCNLGYNRTYVCL
jgi:hypothetical protein